MNACRPRRLAMCATLSVSAAFLAMLNPSHAQVRLESKTATLIDDLVAANRILHNQGIADGFSQVSGRSPTDPAHFYMARRLDPFSVTATDIMEFDSDGNVVGNDPRTPDAERFIHSEIYKAEAGTDAVVHAHAPSVISFSIANVPLRPVFHMSGFLGKGTPIFEIRSAVISSADTDLLIRTPLLGAKLAQKLGKSNVVLMRGHGFTAVASSVSVAVFRSVYTDQNARIQSEALKLGTPRFLTEQEAQMAQKTMEGLSGPLWEMWKKQVGPR
ncbi:MAG: hypothetical protein NVSMB6_07810 [Burkholderiaceae bacterium]